MSILKKIFLLIVPFALFSCSLVFLNENSFDKAKNGGSSAGMAYTVKDYFYAFTSGNIYKFDMDSGTGNLLNQATVSSLVPGGLVFSDASNNYIALPLYNSNMRYMQINNDGTLNDTGTHSVYSGSSNNASFSRDGRFIYFSTTTNTVTFYSTNPDYSLNSQFDTNLGGVYNVNFVCTSNTEDAIYTAQNDANSTVTKYYTDSAGMTLGTPAPEVKTTTTGLSITKLLKHKSLDIVYAINNSSSITVNIIKVPFNGTSMYTQNFSIASLKISDIAFNPLTNRLYLLGDTGSTTYVITSDIDAAGDFTGTTAPQVLNTPTINNAKKIKFSADYSYAYISNYTGGVNYVFIYSVNPSTGVLNYTNSVSFSSTTVYDIIPVRKVF